MSRASRRLVREIEAALGEVERLHPSPVDASDDDWDWLADVYELNGVVIGGLRGDGISTASVNGGLQAIRRIVSTHAERMSAEQRAALEALAHLLEEA